VLVFVEDVENVGGPPFVLGRDMPIFLPFEASSLFSARPLPIRLGHGVMVCMLIPDHGGALLMVQPAAFLSRRRFATNASRRRRS